MPGTRVLIALLALFVPVSQARATLPAEQLSAPAEQPQPELADTSARDNPAFQPYVRMLKMGVPLPAVQQKMVKDGLAADARATFAAAFGAAASDEQPLAARPPPLLPAVRPLLASVRGQAPPSSVGSQVGKAAAPPLVGALPPPSFTVLAFHETLLADDGSRSEGERGGAAAAAAPAVGDTTPAKQAATATAAAALVAAASGDAAASPLAPAGSTSVRAHAASVLDQKRSTSVGVGLARLRLAPDAVATALAGLSPCGTLTEEQARLIFEQALFPTPAELVSIRERESAPAPLSEADAFFAALVRGVSGASGSVAYYAAARMPERAAALYWRAALPATLARLRLRLRMVVDASRALLAHEPLKRLVADAISLAEATSAALAAAPGPSSSSAAAGRAGVGGRGASGMPRLRAALTALAGFRAARNKRLTGLHFLVDKSVVAASGDAAAAALQRLPAVQLLCSRADLDVEPAELAAEVQAEVAAAKRWGELAAALPLPVAPAPAAAQAPAAAADATDGEAAVAAAAAHLPFAAFLQVALTALTAPEVGLVALAADAQRDFASVLAACGEIAVRPAGSSPTSARQLFAAADDFSAAVLRTHKEMQAAAAAPAPAPATAAARAPASAPAPTESAGAAVTDRLSAIRRSVSGRSPAPASAASAATAARLGRAAQPAAAGSVASLAQRFSQAPPR